MSIGVCGSGKAVASTGPLLWVDDRCVKDDCSREIGGEQINDNKDSDDPCKTYMNSKLGSYTEINKKAGGATDHLGLAQS